MRIPGVVRFGIKAGLCCSAVSLTIDKGVWKDSETTGELYQELRERIKPYVKPIVDQIPFEIPKLPQTGDIASTAKTTWNKGVMASFVFLAELPELSWEYLKKGSTYAYENVQYMLNDVQNTSEPQTKNEPEKTK